MGILQVLKDLFTTEEPPNLSGSWDVNPPSNGQEPLDVTVNPTPTARLERQLGRLLNLYNVKKMTPACSKEIVRYKDSITGLGYTAPNNAAETQALIDALEK